ncbi:MAG TPA: hypothetical protein VF602_07660 [Pedobacter sp.]|jgi:CPA1 family monovalent cation:H+ antiporter
MPNILEGESLLNDASSLIIFRFALILNILPAEQVEQSPILQQMKLKWESGNNDDGRTMNDEIKVIYNSILQKQREYLINEKRSHERLDENIIRKYLHRIDMEEEKLHLM